MPVSIEGDGFPLSPEQVASLWDAVRTARQFPDDAVTVRVVDEAEIKDLNAQYRGKDAPTNVLTFTYPATPELPESQAQHDIPLCLPIAQGEAATRKTDFKSYVALLLVHAFLHCTGLDHEKSPDEESVTQKLEHDILNVAGFTPQAL